MFLRAQKKAAHLATMEPADPAGMRADLTSVVAAARAAKPEDAEMATLLDDIDARFSAMAARLHDFIEAKAASQPEDARAALDAVLLGATSSEAFLAAGHRRCDGPRSATRVSGRLPPEVIQRIVRAEFNKMRLCYEDGLRRDVTLDGRVMIRFVIDHDGHTSGVTEAPPTTGHTFDWNIVKDPAKVAPDPRRMPDPKVTECVLAAFRGLVFPTPEGGIVTVTYPIMFAPGG